MSLICQALPRQQLSFSAGFAFVLLVTNLIGLQILIGLLIIIESEINKAGCWHGGHNLGTAWLGGILR
jgi:hypothetical protein